MKTRYAITLATHGWVDDGRKRVFGESRQFWGITMLAFFSRSSLVWFPLGGARAEM